MPNQPQPIERHDTNGHLTDAEGGLIRDPKCTYRDCQPQPAWEQDFEQKFVTPPDKDIRAMCLGGDFFVMGSAKNVKVFIRSLLATERSKWVDEVITKIKQEMMKLATSQFDQQMCHPECHTLTFQKVIDILNSTPLPKGETV